MVVDADDRGIGGAGSADGLATDGAVVLVPDPSAGAEVRAGDQFQERGADADGVGHIAQGGTLWSGRVRAVVERGLFGQGVKGDVGFDLAVVLDDDVAGVGEVADDGEVEFPLVEDGAGDVLAVGTEDHEHALLALGQHHLVGGHLGFALGALVEVQLDADAALAGHLDARAGQAGGAHVLDGDDGVGLHQFEAGFDEELLGEGIADLNGGALLLTVGTEFGRGHGGAVDAVAAGLGADVDHRVADAGGGAEEDAVLGGDADGHGVDQRIAIVGGVEVDLAADGGNADAVAVAADAADDAVHDPAGAGIAGQAEAEGVEVGDGAGAHGEDVAGGCRRRRWRRPGKAR